MANLSELERIERGREAAVLLAHPIMQEVFRSVEDGVVEQWKAAPDAETREKLWAGLHGARRVETHLRALVDDGAMARRAAEQAAQDDRTTDRGVNV